VIPVPETCAPAACARVSGAETVIAMPPNRVMEAMTAVSTFVPLSIVMV